MKRRILKLSAAAFVAIATASLAQTEPRPGSFGFAISVDGEGFFLNPTLKTATVKSVSPGFPAAAAGVKAGDQIVEVEGKRVAGARARDLEPLMQKNVGEKLTLKVQRQTGEVIAVTMVAAEKPK